MNISKPVLLSIVLLAVGIPWIPWVLNVNVRNFPLDEEGNLKVKLVDDEVWQLITELQSRLASLNASLIEQKERTDILNTSLTSRIEDLEGQMIFLQSVIGTLQTQINSLNASYVDLLDRVDVLEATPLTSAILSNSTHDDSVITTTAIYPDWTDMANTSVTITLNRTCSLLIMLSLKASSAEAGFSDSIAVRVMVDESVNAYPERVRLLTESHSYEDFSCHFYQSSVSAGTYTVRIQWCIEGYGAGDPPDLLSASSRTLLVMALSE